MRTHYTCRRRRPLGVVLAILVAVGMLFASMKHASARTYNEGQTVLFRDQTIGDGDEVRGDLDIVFGSVTCESGAQIDGNVHAFFGTFDKRDGCEVQGHVDQFGGSDAFEWAGPALSPWSSDDLYRQNHHVLRKLGWDVVVLLAFLLFPVRVRVALDRVEQHPGLSFVAGSAALIAVIPVGVLLLLSVIGIPLIPLEIAALFTALWIGNAAVGLLIGRRLYELLRPHTTPSPLGALVLGLVLVTAAETLPVVGWFVSALVGLVGLGAALLAFVRETSFRSFAAGSPGAPPAPGVPPPPGPPMNRPA